MSTGIQWTDETWNPVVGCTQVSPGCAHCYAKTLHDMRHKAYLAGKKVAPQYTVPFETVQLKPDRLMAPLGWRRPRRVFVNSVSDLFHDDVPDAFVVEVFATMAACYYFGRGHDFQALTKRPARMLALLSSSEFIAAVRARLVELRRQHRSVADRVAALKLLSPLDEERCHYDAPLIWPLPNVWVGVSVENQRWANERIPLLLQTPAALRFLSCEPLLGPLDFYEAGSLGGEWGDPFSFSALAGAEGVDPPIPGIDWCIVGGESGHGARPFDIQWARDIVRQCRSAGTAPFVKQLGRSPVRYDLDGWVVWPEVDLHDRHGADMAEWPEDLRVREFPT